MGFYNIAAGIILLAFGRRLFWIFVAIAGFLAGLEMSGVMLIGQPQWLHILVAVGAGLLGAFLAMLAQGLAFTMAGFFAGVYLAATLAPALMMAGPGNIQFYIIGAGAIGALLAFLLMDPAIVVLSSMVGAGAIVGELGLAPSIRAVVFIILTATGILIQTKLTGPAKKED